MPLNSGIILAGEPVRMNDPLEVMGRAMSLREMAQRGALREQQMAAIQREEQQAMRAQGIRDRFQEAVASGASDDDLRKIDAGLAGDYIKGRQGEKKGATDQELAELDLFGNRMGILAQAVGSLRAIPPEQRAQRAAQLKQELIQAGVFKSGQIPDYPLDDASLDQLTMQAMALKDQADEMRAAAQEARAAETHAVTMRKGKAGAIREELATAGQLAAGAGPQQWSSMRKLVSGEIAPLVPQEFSPQAQQAVVAMGETPQQRAARIHQEESRKLTEERNKDLRESARERNAIAQTRAESAGRKTEAAAREEIEKLETQEQEIRDQIAEIKTLKEGGLYRVRDADGRGKGLAQALPDPKMTVAKRLRPDEQVDNPDYAKAIAGIDAELATLKTKADRLAKQREAKIRQLAGGGGSSAAAAAPKNPYR